MWIHRKTDESNFGPNRKKLKMVEKSRIRQIELPDSKAKMYYLKHRNIIMKFGGSLKYLNIDI